MHAPHTLREYRHDAAIYMILPTQLVRISEPANYFFCVNTHFLFVERADLPRDLSIEQCCQKQGVIEGHMDYARSTLSLRLSKNWLFTLAT